MKQLRHRPLLAHPEVAHSACTFVHWRALIGPPALLLPTRCQHENFSLATETSGDTRLLTVVAVGQGVRKLCCSLGCTFDGVLHSRAAVRVIAAGSRRIENSCKTEKVAGVRVRGARLF